MAATNSSTLHRAARPVAVPARMWLQARACAVLAVVALLVACDTGGPAAPTAPTMPPVAAPTFTLSGEVHSNRFGGPLANARVHASGRQTATDEDGRYQFDGLSGEVTVEVSYTGHVSAFATVTMDQDQTADFTLEPGAPPFEVTAYISPRVIDSGDPSSFRNIEYAGRGTRDIFDRRIGTWTQAEVFLFHVQYSGRELEFQVNIEFGSVEAARREVDTYAPAFGQLPAFLMTGAREVEIHGGVENHGGNTHNGTFHIHSGQGETDIRNGFLEEALIHEAAHVSLDSLHRMTPAWRAAQEADAGFISTYGRDHPDQEDLAESVLSWYAVRRRAERLDDDDRTAILEQIPNRLEYFDQQPW